MDLIVARLRAEGEVSVAELAELTGHSEMTIRRDLDHLADKGVLRRVHGGAVSLLPRGQEPPYAIRERMAVDAKRPWANSSATGRRSSWTGAPPSWRSPVLSQNGTSP